MQQYLYTTPQILDDNIFLLYGGMTGTSSAAQREIAYTLAEEQMVEYLNSYLTPTIVSGTYLWRGRNPLELDYGWIISVDTVSIASRDGKSACSMTSVDGCHVIRNAQFGYVDVGSLVNCGGCKGVVGAPPYTISVVYQSGMATGTYTSKAMLQALTLAAQINLNELDVSLSNESTADIGVTEFSNMKYREVRMRLTHTAFGNSPTANRIARLVRKYRARPSTGFS